MSAALPAELLSIAEDIGGYRAGFTARDRALRWWQVMLSFAKDDVTDLAINCTVKARQYRALIDELCHFGGSAYGNVKALPDGKEWRPALATEKGRDVLTLAIWSNDLLADWTAAPEAVQCIELLALDAKDPAKWRPMTGLVSALGEADAMAAFHDDRALRIHRHPLGWLRAGGVQGGGVCVLDWQDTIGSMLLTWPGVLVADDEAHAKYLHGKTRRKRELPEIHFVDPATLRQAAE